MISIYSSLIKGLADHRRALEIIRKSGILSGLETTELSETSKKIRDSGLLYSIHDPHLNGMNNLADPDLGALYRNMTNDHRMEIIREADAPVVGFHCGFAAARVFKMRAFSDVPVPDTLYSDKTVLYKQMMDNLREIEAVVNKPTANKSTKSILVESMDYLRPQPIDWTIQTEDAIKHKKIIEETIRRFGLNAGYRFVNEISFLDRIINPPLHQQFPTIGYLFDISHNFITADAKIHEGTYKGTVEDYFESIIKIAGIRTYQLHVNVPSGNSADGYLDHHLPFVKDNYLSDKILELTRFVVRNAPQLEVITLEISGATDPETFARNVTAQAQYFIKSVLR